MTYQYLPIPGLDNLNDGKPGGWVAVDFVFGEHDRGIRAQRPFQFWLKNTITDEHGYTDSFGRVDIVSDHIPIAIGFVPNTENRTTWFVYGRNDRTMSFNVPGEFLPGEKDNPDQPWVPETQEQRDLIAQQPDPKCHSTMTYVYVDKAQVEWLHSQGFMDAGKYAHVKQAVQGRPRPGNKPPVNWDTLPPQYEWTELMLMDAPPIWMESAYGD